MQQSALITGAANRIGRAMALALAGMDYDIFLHYNTSRKPAEQTQQLVEQKGQACILKQADFRNRREVEQLIPGCGEEGELNLLINNASQFVESDIHLEGADLLDDLFDINFKAPYLLTKQFARHSREGMIINMLDTKINQHQTKHLDYLLTKKSLEDFTYLSALQLAPEIRVNGIAPGLILAPEDAPDDYLKDTAKAIPRQQPGAPGQIIRTLAYFIDNPFVTGQVINVDGGEHLLR